MISLLLSQVPDLIKLIHNFFFFQVILFYTSIDDTFNVYVIFPYKL